MDDTYMVKITSIYGYVSSKYELSYNLISKYSVYRAFLQYLYTDTVDLPPEDAIGKKCFIYGL